MARRAIYLSSSRARAGPMQRLPKLALTRRASIWASAKKWRRNEPALEFAFITNTAIRAASLRPAPRASILSIDPYVPGKSGAPGAAKVFKLSANETPLGPSPRAKQALRDYADHLQDYPDGEARAIREALGARHGLNPEKIVCGNGSDEVLHLLASAYIGPRDEGIFSELGFLFY